MTPEQKARAKFNAAQRANGRPMIINNDSAVAHVRWLHDEMGMPLQLIADRSRTSLGCVYNQWKQNTGTITRNNRDKILAVKPDQGAYRGAFVSPIGTSRRLGALAMAGYPVRWLAPIVDVAHGNLLRAYSGRAQYVFAETASKVSEAYVKYESRDPADFGITANVSAVARHYARRHGHAPPHAWDLDTLDDPGAFAEWTGACGTERGYRLHLDLGGRNFLAYRRTDGAKYWASACEPCRGAHELYRIKGAASVS